MKKTPEELKNQVKLKGINKWTVHNCSMCGYPCGYVFRGEDVFYDPGCDCVFGEEKQRSWENLAEEFNRNQPENNPDFAGKHPEAYSEYYKVWDFTQ